MVKKDKRKGCKQSNTHSYEERVNLHSDEKRKIVEKALMFIKEDKTYFFDVSTSIELLAKAVDKGITVYTHSLDNLYILSEKKDILVHSIGEFLNKSNRFFYKPEGKNYFDGIEFDVAFLGATAITKDGIYYDDKEDAVIKGEVAKKAKRVILLAEHEKYANTALYKGMDLDDIDIIIVDPISSDYFVDIINSQDIKLNPSSLIIM
ncbi:hypothetical protein [Clostridium arbusti]|uniref:hypothetical protein n=1 Tax=Clostridium arbusti TaxID=1137848 RepID=UPI00028A09AD|nr:hypothetical protein [Clostridium arbusti]